MSKKKTLADIMPAAGGDPVEHLVDMGRDFVTFYSLLTRTLEEACGRDQLAKRLAEERSAGSTAGDNVASALNGLSRCYRRIGFITEEHNVEAFSREFARHVALAVSRPEGQVALLVRLFAAGEDGGAFDPVCGATPHCHRCLLTRECDHFNYPRKPEMASRPPAGRLMSGNAATLSDHDLMSVILFGDKATGQEELVKTLFARYGRFLAMARAEPREFSGLRGMTKPQALRLAAINVLHRRLLDERRGEMLRITSAQDLYDRYAPELRDMRSEMAILVLLDSQNHVIRDAWFGQDSPNITHVKVGDLLRSAIVEYAVGVALVHNHPGNNPSPSQGDVNYTLNLRLACETLGLKLVDHVIVADSGYYSFAENGMPGS